MHCTVSLKSPFKFLDLGAFNRIICGLQTKHGGKRVIWTRTSRYFDAHKILYLRALLFVLPQQLGHVFWRTRLQFFEELDCKEPMNFSGRPCYIIQDQTYLHSVYHRNCTCNVLGVLLVFNSIVKIMSSHRIQRRVNIKFFSNKALFKNVLTRHIWHISMPFNLWIFFVSSMGPI